MFSMSPVLCDQQRAILAAFVLPPIALRRRHARKTLVFRRTDTGRFFTISAAADAHRKDVTE